MLSANSCLYKCINWLLECLDEFIEWMGFRNVDESKIKPRVYNSYILW